MLFCLYIDNLLVNLAQSGVSCCIWTIFVGALAYADDIVLIAPTLSGLHKLLQICESYADMFDVFDSLVKAPLMKSHCFSLCDYGTSVMDTLTPSVQRGGKDLRRCLDLPCDSHSFFLPPLSNTLPLFHDMCKRFARFITKCMFTSSELVQIWLCITVYIRWALFLQLVRICDVYVIYLDGLWRSLCMAVYQCTIMNESTVYTGIIEV